jgi:triacylglycerol lipase
MNILLVHGMFDTGSIFKKLEGALAKLGHRCFAPSLQPADGRYGIPDLAQKLDRLVNEFFSPEEDLVIIGFSMGCIVSRYYMQHLGAARRIRAFFAISGPHRGSLLAYLYPGKGAHDLRPGSALLRNLDLLDLHAINVPTHTYWTPFDLMVVPSTSSRWLPACETIIWSLLHPLMPSNHRLCNDIIKKIGLLEIPQRCQPDEQS